MWRVKGGVGAPHDFTLATAPILVVVQAGVLSQCGGWKGGSVPSHDFTLAAAPILVVVQAGVPSRCGGWKGGWVPPMTLP